MAEQCYMRLEVPMLRQVHIPQQFRRERMLGHITFGIKFQLTQIT